MTNRIRDVHCRIPAEYPGPRRISALKVLFAAAECTPFAKVGGLADVASGLPGALRRIGLDVVVVMPHYRSASTVAPLRRIGAGQVIGVDFTVDETNCPTTGNRIWLVEIGGLFDRSGSAYADEDGIEWNDEDRRFGMFSLAVAALSRDAAGIGWHPDVVHLNDWHTASAAPLIAAQGAAASVLTIHNHAFQGLFPPDRLDFLAHAGVDLDRAWLHGRFSFLRAGILAADALTAVSRSYRDELMRPETAFGLDGDFLARAGRLTGIHNGIDLEAWNPASEPSIKARYSRDDMTGKADCKQDLQVTLGLRADPLAPLAVMVSRLSEQKMSDVLPDLIPGLLETHPGLQIAILGRGEHRFEYALPALAHNDPDRVAVRIGYTEAAARQFLAGADMLLHPSRFEPCGLVPIYAKRFGTPPVVTPTGGMLDSVVPFDPRGRPDGTGFMAAGFDVGAISASFAEAIACHADKAAWARLVDNAMAAEWGWDDPAAAFVTVYRTAVASRATVAATDRRR